MSYDLMVFDASVAPREPEAFMDWYRSQTEWSEGHSYDDPARSSVPLRGWFFEMIEWFPAMNGPFVPAGDPIDDERVTDYSVGSSVVYAAFRWSVAEKARASVFELAKKHGVGFFDASSDDGYTWRPGDQH